MLGWAVKDKHAAIAKKIGDLGKSRIGKSRMGLLTIPYIAKIYQMDTFLGSCTG